MLEEGVCVHKSMVKVSLWSNFGSMTVESGYPCDPG